MSLEVEQKRQLEKAISELAKFLSDSSIDLPDQFNSLLPSLLTKLKKLRTAQAELERIEQRDVSGNDPSFASYRRSYRDEINEVRNSFNFELIPLARKLYTQIKKRPDGETLAERFLILIAQSEEQPSSAHISSTSEASKPPQTQTQRSSLVITFNQLRKLENRQRTLDNLVRGFMSARDQLVSCSEAKFKLEEGRRENSTEDIFSDDYWNEITGYLKGAAMIGKDYDLSMFTDLKGSADEFVQELNIATMIAEKVASPQDMSHNALKNAIVDALRHIDNALRLVRRTADKCRERAQTELEGIRELINDIFAGGRETSEPGEVLMHSSPVVQHSQTSSVPSDLTRTPNESRESPEAPTPRTPEPNTTPSN